MSNLDKEQNLRLLVLMSALDPKLSLEYFQVISTYECPVLRTKLPFKFFSCFQ